MLRLKNAKYGVISLVNLNFQLENFENENYLFTCLFLISELLKLLCDCWLTNKKNRKFFQVPLQFRLFASQNFVAIFQVQAAINSQAPEFAPDGA